MVRSSREGGVVIGWCHVYVGFLLFVYASCFFRQASGASSSASVGESFDCNVVETRNESHSLSRLKIASLNAEWLFDGKDDPSYSPWHPGKTSCPGMKHCGTEQGAQEHISKVSEYVKFVNADILNLMEVEDCNILREVIQRSDISEYTPLLRKGIDTATKQNVALLTKYAPTEPLYRLSSKHEYPVEGSKCGYSSSGKRTTLSKNYVAHFEINGMTIAFHGLHLKAFPKDPYSCAKREGQAKIARASIEESIAKGHEVVVFGDINDFSHEYKDVQDSEPRSSVLAILRGEKANGETDLINTMQYLPHEQRYSNWWDKNGNDVVDGAGEYSQIDHVLLTPRLASFISKVEIFHGYDPAMVSDHFPVIVEFDFSKPGDGGAGSYTGGGGRPRQAHRVDAEQKQEEEGSTATVTTTAEIIVGVLAFVGVTALVIKQMRKRKQRTDSSVGYQMTPRM
ncbi:hypothetical protein HOP50_05g38040 [Chloropicon primus]|uniref:Endonuclease/exonuclease/phosphatase domain-containing protein n=1 Tax=Chloropicon primus TaxID=1764295 RepID=A0A5B8MNW9_9CHLO|nr:hypothetical protein A3770_05p37930 [Chloropicon primus]UPR00489.1 hypothetical protein HOP50_05g38040 [Chloropicon primus]|eukprot:QDZ21275.1 hypothetical protein A3770_05p37930 [Chloropicon primus]